MIAILLKSKACKTPSMKWTKSSALKSRLLSENNIDKMKLELNSKGNQYHNEIREMHNIIDSKADKSQMMSVLELKTNTKDTARNMQATDIIHKQIKHLSVLLIEILRHETEKYTKVKEPEHFHKSKWLAMMHQSLSVAEWINRFTPERINDSNLSVPKKIEDFHWLVTKSFNEMSEAVFQCPPNSSALKKPDVKEADSVLNQLDKFLLSREESKVTLPQLKLRNTIKAIKASKFKSITSKSRHQRQKISFKPRVLIESKFRNHESMNDSQNSFSGMTLPIYALSPDPAARFEKIGQEQSDKQSSGLAMHRNHVKSLDRNMVQQNHPKSHL